MHTKVEDNKTKENKTITVVDDLGCTVTVKLYPKRIVSLAPSNTEILFALGLGNRVVGVTDYCNYPPEVVKLKEEGKIESVGGYTTVNVEKVAELKPDLVVAHSGNGIGTIEAIRKLGIPVICLDPKNFEDIMRDIELLGKITGTEENATKLIKFMRSKIEEVEKIVSKAKNRPRVVHIIWSDPIWVSGKGTFVDE
ncbi:MAG TPA: ABC transporter substrate-binding protein, partial [Archaeoglobus profundus]|nr:ABC transporter substrate-binding protein [Archaeoglobus profundus]